MANSEYNYIPTYIRRTINNRPKDVVTAKYWNELFNLLITQGDHTAEELGNILNYFSTRLVGVESEIAESTEAIANIREVFRINVTYSNGVYSVDKTFAEIKAAYDAGQQPFVVLTGGTFDLVYTLANFDAPTDGSEPKFVDFERYLVGDGILETEMLRIYSYTTDSGSNVVKRIDEFKMPTSLKNPNALTFTGGATGSYDGSEPETVHIPVIPYKVINENTAARHSHDNKTVLDGITAEKVIKWDDNAAGADGVGIQSVTQTTTSTEDGGANIITVTKTDGTSSTFTVRNGSKGSTGDTGADGAPGIYYGATQPTGDTHPVWIDPDGGPDDGGLLPAVTADDNGKVLRVVSSAWTAVDMPTGGTDMGITGATVGQIAKITAVDASGVPTAWSPVDMPSGGGGDGGAGAKEFRLIQSITLDEQSDRVDISVDSNGNAFALHEVYVMLAAQSYGNAENVTFLPNGRWTSGDAYITSSNKSSSSSDNWKNSMIFHAVYADGVICSEQLPAKGQNNNLTTSFAAGQSIISKISIVAKFAAGCTFLVIGR